MAGNGMLTDEERQDYYKVLREANKEDMEASGVVMAEGEDPYRDDWQMDLSWPEEASVKVRGEWVPESMDAEIVSATLVVAKQDQRKGIFNGRVRAATLKRQTFGGNDIKAMREAVRWSQLREWTGTPDPFAYGSSMDVSSLGGSMQQFIPLWPGPVTRQLYWQDYWQMSAKSFEAYNHDPISWRCVHMKAEFSLGRGLDCKVTKTGAGPGRGQTYDKAAAVWQEFWDRNKMDQRVDTIARDYCWGGEQFLRYFNTGPSKLTIRSLDPATIYDLITDPEDIETVFAYHQQFQTAYQLYPPGKSTPPSGTPKAPTGTTTPGAVTRYIIRQILPQEIDHYKANASAFERRGRSDLFPALGWIKRLRDYLTSHVIHADMLSRICWDLEVAGNQTALNSIKSQLFPGGRAPAPGTVFGHNTASKLTSLAPPHQATTNRGDPILDALVTMVADSIGLPKDWLGFGMQNTRAGALVATEPAAKSLLELQGTLEGMLHDAFNRVMARARITDAQLEVTFPSIAAEDRQQKLDDLGTMEANGYISKRTAARIAAKEMGITTYDFDEEQQLIMQEFQDEKGSDTPQEPRRQVILATKRQAVKLDITKEPALEDVPPGLLEPTEGSTLPAPGSPDGTQRTVAGGGSHKTGVTRGGAPADENPISSAGAKNIRKDSTNMRESEEEQVFTLTASELHWLLLRERQGPRRRPDDPEFQRAAAGYRNEAEDNLSELARDAGGG